jgi:hypothetical protein
MHIINKLDFVRSEETKKLQSWSNWSLAMHINYEIGKNRGSFNNNLIKGN